MFYKNAISVIEAVITAEISDGNYYLGGISICLFCFLHIDIAVLRMYI